MKTKPGIETVHTSTPWQVDAGSKRIFGPAFSIAKAYGPNSQADAAFIVHAVNSHDDLIQGRDRLREVNAELLAACDKIERIASRQIEIGAQSVSALEACVDSLRDIASCVIAKAKSQPSIREDGCTCPADGSGAVKPCPVHPGVCL